MKVKVTPHALRHYFATRFLERNQGDIATLATVLGHANISTTTRYLHPNAQRVQAMVEELWGRRGSRNEHMPIGFYLLLGAALSWVGLLALLGAAPPCAVNGRCLADLSHLTAIEAFLAELLARADELGLPSEIERDVREFQSLVADVLHGGAALSVQETQDLSDFLHDLTLALPYLPEEGADGAGD